ncbi:hypothetical protein O9K51_11261 [Purpureocillium lavendulum]|uniref:Uncharacterized protein n=1 Tax=Purpureocillium lavendulum TaxID=1247861 RepID=A0AB34FB44_9HYPO|nr:hypothetical protein O9K51_11261 [Purpureocillium lavendulum]
MRTAMLYAFVLGANVICASADAYALLASFDANNFFDSFDFFTGPDPTHGFVEYVDRATAQQEGIIGVSNTSVVLGVDYDTIDPPRGRVGERLYKQQQTDRLRKLFKKTAVNHDNPMHWIDGYIDSADVPSVLSQLRLSHTELNQANRQGNYPCVRDHIVYYTQGRHRAKAALGRFWTVKLSCISLERLRASKVIKRQTERFQHEERDSDGRIYSKLREYTDSHLDFFEWHERLSPEKQRIFQTVKQRRSVVESLDRLIDLPGVIDFVHLGGLKDMFQYRVDAELLDALRSIYTQWSDFTLGDPALQQAVDRDTVTNLDGRAPTASQADHLRAHLVQFQALRPIRRRVAAGVCNYHNPQVTTVLALEPNRPANFVHKEYHAYHDNNAGPLEEIAHRQMSSIYQLVLILGGAAEHLAVTDLIDCRLLAHRAGLRLRQAGCSTIVADCGELACGRLQQIYWRPSSSDQLYGRVLFPLSAAVVVFADRLGGIKAAASVTAGILRFSPFVDSLPPPSLLVLCRKETCSEDAFSHHLTTELLCMLREAHPEESRSFSEVRQMWSSRLRHVRIVTQRGPQCWPEISQAADQTSSIRYNEGYGLSGCHFRRLLCHAVEYFGRESNDHSFNILEALGVQNPVTDHAKVYLEALLRQKEGSQEGRIKVVALCLAFNAYRGNAYGQ